MVKRWFLRLMQRWAKVMSVPDAEKNLIFRSSINFQRTGSTKMISATLLRKFYTDKSTIGSLNLKDYSCFILEPTARRVEGVPVCIPGGSYQILMRWSEKHQREVPGLLNVPGRFDIEIHPGNFPQDTLGCLLPGKEYRLDYVSDSRETCNKLFDLIRTCLKEGDLFINIIG